MKKFILCTVIIFTLAAFFAAASEIEEQYEFFGVEELERYTAPAKNFDRNFDFGNTVKGFTDGSSDFSPMGIIRSIFRLLFGEIYESISGITGIAAAVFCLGVLGSAGTGKNMDITFYVCCAIVFSIGCGTVKEIIKAGIEAMEAMKIFMAAAIPVLGGLMAGSGGVARCALASTSVLAITGIIDVFIKVIMPICTCSLMLCGVNSLSDEFSMAGLENGLNRFVMWSIGVIMVIFTGILSLFAITSGLADNVIGKTAKFMAGSFIPIVGGVVSETLDSVIACSRLIKGAVGAGGIIAILYICLVPSVKIAAVLILYNLTAVVLSPVADRRIVRLMGGFSAVLKIMLAVVVSSAIMFIICAGMLAVM